MADGFSCRTIWEKESNCNSGERLSKERIQLVLRNVKETVCEQLETDKKPTSFCSGKQSLTNLLLDNDSTDLTLSCKQLAYVVGNLFFCLHEYLHRGRLSKRCPKSYDADCYSCLETTALELKDLLSHLQRKYEVSHQNELYYVFLVKLVRVFYLYVLSNQLDRTRNYNQVYQSFWNVLDSEIESCLKVGPLPILLVDKVSSCVENGTGAVSLSWQYILQECLDKFGKFLASKQGKELIKDKVQTTVVFVLRIATKMSVICSTGHIPWDLRTCKSFLDYLETHGSSSTSERIDSDDQYKPKETCYKTQLKALVVLQQLASDYSHQLVSIWNILFPYGTNDKKCESLIGLLISSPFPRIRLVAAKCISEVITNSKNFLSRMVVAVWKPTDRVALPREVQYILLHIHRDLCCALSKEQHSSVLPAIIRCVSILFKVFPYCSLGVTTNTQLQKLHRDIFILFHRLVSLLLDILKRERTDETTYSAVVSSLGTLLSIPFRYQLYENKNMELESRQLFNLITEDEGILASLIDRRNKNLSSGSLLSDTYSALCQISGCYFSTILEMWRQRPAWKQEMVDHLQYDDAGGKNEALQFLIIKFLYSIMKSVSQENETISEHCTTQELLTEFWCCIASQVFDLTHLHPNAASLVLSFLAMVPQTLVEHPSTSLPLLQPMINFTSKHWMQVDNASVRGSAMLAFIRMSHIAIQCNYIPSDLSLVAEMVVDSMLQRDAAYALFSKATETFVEFVRLVQCDQHSYQDVGMYLFQRGEELAYHVIDIFPSSTFMFRISVVRILGSLVSFHDGNGRCFLQTHPCIADKVIELLCHILDCQTIPNNRSLIETKLLWNSCYMLSWIALHCPHDDDKCMGRTATIFRSAFHRLQEEDGHNGNIKVQLACVSVLCSLGSTVSIDSTHKQWIQYWLRKVNHLEEPFQWKSKWTFVEKLDKLWNQPS